MNTSKSCVSVMFVGLADGHFLPPYVVYTTLIIMNTWIQGGSSDTRYTRTKFCRFDAVTFVDCLQSIIPYVRRLPEDDPKMIN